MSQSIQNSIDKHYDDVKKVCSDIYVHPETSMKEYETSEKLISLLKRKGFELIKNPANLETAFIATKTNGVGPRLAICAEYDALPGIGHAGGHHLISGISLLTGIALADTLDNVSGAISIFGTPGEETGDGKPPLLESGYFDGYDAAIMIHPHNCIWIKPDITSIGTYDFYFTGIAAHAGSAPFDGVNALDAVVQMYNNVSMMREQLKDGTHRCNRAFRRGHVKFHS